MKRGRIITTNPPAGETPALVLCDPQRAFNLGMAVRAASCFNVGQVWFSGSAAVRDAGYLKRLPREERMKGYADVQLIHSESPFAHFPRGAVPVAVEVRPGSECLWDFVHPERAVYVFGPENGSIDSAWIPLCHRFVIIPTLHCMNLATAISVVLAHRAWSRGDRYDLAASEGRGLLVNEPPTFAAVE